MSLPNEQIELINVVRETNTKTIWRTLRVQENSAQSHNLLASDVAYDKEIVSLMVSNRFLEPQERPDTVNKANFRGEEWNVSSTQSATKNRTQILLERI